jgi:carbamoyltransferase
MYVLGVWDGHDAGAALLNDDIILYAANEERFTKRKLEINFPYNSIAAALAYAKIKPTDVQHVAFSTTEFTKTLERLFPSMKESYYQFRRRKILRPRFENLRHKLKYGMTSVGIVPMSTTISKIIIARQLSSMGFKDFKLHVVEHHMAHAATAAFTSPYNKSLVITVDGLGDGLSGSISVLENGKLSRHARIMAGDSVGIFYEQVTNLVGMRELEDEGKVMAMADYSYPFSFEDNRFKDFFKVEGTAITAKYGPLKQFDMLQRMGWQMPREQFSYMAQQLLESVMVKFVSNAIDRFNIGNVVFAGGIFSNVKANMAIRNLDTVKHWYVFPHMGDGGIALGSALYASYMLTGKTNYDFGAYLGDGYSEDATEAAVKKEDWIKHEMEGPHEQAKHAAELIADGNYIMWFQGRMEYGPRALGDRSILAPSDSEEVKDRLNTYVKRREWFQPFAPAVLDSEVDRILEYDDKRLDKFMTMAYMVRKEFRDATKSVVNIDGSARPQMVGEENKMYEDVLRNIKRIRGYGVMLNTSFNLHGAPIVMSPEDALNTMKLTKTKYMFMNGLFLTNRRGV